MWTRRSGGPDWMPITPKTGSIFHADSHPILIRRGAIQDEMPVRDLYLSPCHSLIMFQGFIPAGCLINGTTIVQFGAVDVIE